MGELVTVSDLKLDDVPKLFYAQDTIPKGEAVKATLIDFVDGSLATSPTGGEILKNLDAETNCNLVFIFGNARSGKSFMMNCLVGSRGLFQVANSSTPCTKGVDISSYVAKHSALLDHVKTYAAVDDSKKGPDCHVGFVDVEGQGAEDGTYDTMLALPLLLTSKVVLFNHKGAPTVSHMLSQLGVLARAAEYIDLSEPTADGEEEKEENDGGKRKFGHLHVLFRDFSFEGDSEDVFDQLLAPEPVPKKEKKNLNNKSALDPSKAVVERNDIRALLRDNFESINVWLFKQPATGDILTQNNEVPEEAIDTEFTATVKKMMAKMVEQLSVPVMFQDAPLSGPRIVSLLGQVSTQLNEGGAINVPSVFRAMEKETLSRVAALCAADFDVALAAAKKKIPMAPDSLEKELGTAKTAMLKRFDEELRGCMLEEEKKNKRKDVEDNTNILTSGALADNMDTLKNRIKEVIDARLSAAKTEFEKFCNKNMPIKESGGLEKEFANCKKTAKKNVESDLASIEGCSKLKEFQVMLMEGEEGLQEFLTLKTIQNESSVKDATIKALQDEAIKQQDLLIKQNKKLEEFLGEEKSNAAEMEKEMDNLKKQKVEEEERLAANKKRMDEQAKEMEELRKKKRKCTIL